MSEKGGVGRIKWLGIFFLVFLCAGCREKTPSGGATGMAVTGAAVTGAASTGGAAVQDEGDAEEDLSLSEKSRKYAGQIAAGLYAPVIEDFSAALADALTEEKLKMSWESAGEGVTGYQGIEDTEEFDSDGYEVVQVTLRYRENKGRMIRFVYEPDETIAGLWFYPVELPDSNESGEKSPQNSPDTTEKAALDFVQKDIAVGREPYSLAGKLTLPSGVDKAPVVILLQSGMDMDMDGTVGEAGNKPLEDLAKGLAERGVASLRYNRRWCEYPDSLSGQAGIQETLLEDAWYAIDQMYNAREIDSSRIYVAAMGKAADYLPALVEKKARRLSGAVLMGARPVKATEQFYGEDARTVDCDARYFIDENSTLPLLILQGEKDFETPVSHYEAWQKLLKGRSHTVYRSYQNLNHYFMPSAQNGDASDYDTSGHMARPPIEDIAAWCLDDRPET